MRSYPLASICLLLLQVVLTTTSCSVAPQPSPTADEQIEEIRQLERARLRALGGEYLGGIDIGDSQSLTQLPDTA